MQLDRIEAYQSPELLGITVSYSSNPGQYDYLSLSKLKSVWTKAKEIHCEQQVKKEQNEIENDRYSLFYNSMMNDVSKSLHGLGRFRDNDKCVMMNWMNNNK